MTTIPDHAERLNLTDHTRLERVPSKLLPGLEQMQHLLRCPRCRRERPITYTKINCAGCGLAMEAGAFLAVWDEEPAKEPAHA